MLHLCNILKFIIDSFNERIKTTHKINPDASAVHGIYAKDLEGCRGEIAVLTDFCVWMKNQEVDCVLTYNGEAFDRRMLNARCEKLGINYDYFNTILTHLVYIVNEENAMYKFSIKTTVHCVRPFIILLQ